MLIIKMFISLIFILIDCISPYNYRYAAAESDCNTSIALEENYLKSWQRRATVRSKLGKLQEAIEGMIQ